MHTLSLLLYIAGCSLIFAGEGQAQQSIRNSQFYVAPSFSPPAPQNEEFSEPLILLEDVPSHRFFESLSSAADPAENSLFIEEQEENNDLDRDDARNSNILQSSRQFLPNVNSLPHDFDVFENIEDSLRRNKGSFGASFVNLEEAEGELPQTQTFSDRNILFGLGGLGRVGKEEGDQSFKIDSSLTRGFKTGFRAAGQSGSGQDSRRVALDRPFESGFSEIGGAQSGQSVARQFIGPRNQSPGLRENNFQFALRGSSEGTNQQLPEIEGSQIANAAGDESTFVGGSSFNFFTDSGSNDRNIFGVSEGASSALPQSFTPGVKFIPPVYDPELDKKERSDSSFLIGINTDGAGAIDRHDCTVETYTVTDTHTSLVPVTTEIIQTVSVTSAFTHTRTEIVTVRSTSTLTNSVERTHVATVFSTVQHISTQTKYVSPTTLFSTFTSVVTDYFDKVVVSTQTDTFVLKTTDYVTITDSRMSTTTVPVPHYSTAYLQIPAFVRSFPLTKTETVTTVSTLPAQIVYNSLTLQKTETLTATQILQPKTVIRTKTVIVPSYSTIYTTSVQTRTKTLRSTVPVIQTTTATSISSIYRVGVAANTEYSTVTTTVSNVQYFTTQVPTYVTVSITNNIPTTTTRTTTIYGGIQRTVTAAGAIVTEYRTHTSYASVYKTVTNTLTTPIVYATQTVTLNCPQKK